METTVDGTFFQEEDYVRIKSTGETGRINAIAGGVAYVLMDTTDESRVFAAYIDEDAAIERVGTESTTEVHDSSTFSTQLSEQWLLERSYHAQLLNGKELSAATFTETMKNLIDIIVPRSAQSAESRLPEEQPRQKSNTFSVPISAWQEITPAEARITYQQGKPLLFYSKHTWEHEQEESGVWSLNRDMRTIIYGSTFSQPGATAGTTYAVCYHDTRHGTFSNVAWKTRFSSDAAHLFDHHKQPITFLRPATEFPFTTHYTVIAPDGYVTEYPDHVAALEGFESTPMQEVTYGNAAQLVAPHFCHYHEVTCPDGTYRLEFFGPRMYEQGYKLTEQPLALL